ncbi:AdeC/AdeK/OprM family multidrug efflux complex outer membrane factor [Stakelama sediminis]|uniref:Multidrug efflux system outer membrane protein n=1 Tax=Stakelama sediminis TaxID=463200 RepID=A0A840YYR0_9SPHN|nr:efflux transporter outer membrane subunit [Stakelama sediminis]MBB5718735.1 multidrug efflux system outer membrane protein [Stakelama sediminis]
MIRRSISLIALVGLSACSLEPAYHRPEAAVPPSWPVGSAYLHQSEASLPSVSYQEIFTDPRLQKLIKLALANNRDLRVAAANIASARAQYRIQRANRLPEIDASAGATVAHGSSGTTTSATGGTGSTTGTAITGGSGTNTYYTADVGTTAFEIDLFGRLKSLSDAALNQYFATEAGARATRLALVASIANAWLQHAADSSLLGIAQETVKSAQKSVSLTQSRLNGGIAPRTDLRQAQLILSQAQADLAASQTALAQDANLMRLLVGTDVDASLLPDNIGKASDTLRELPAGLNSTILLRRPDVVQAEYQLKSMNAQIGVARAALFPRISLTAVLGLASGSLRGLFDGDGFNWSVRPSASYPIFQAGAGRAGVAQARAERDAALATYEKTIQTAFREVADALARRGTIDGQLAATQRLESESQDYYTLSDARYRGGIDTFLQSLTAQRSLYSAQRSLVQVELTRANNLVTLYQVLGGDQTLDATANGPVPVTEEKTPAQ